MSKPGLPSAWTDDCRVTLIWVWLQHAYALCFLFEPSCSPLGGERGWGNIAKKHKNKGRCGRHGRKTAACSKTFIRIIIDDA